VNEGGFVAVDIGNSTAGLAVEKEGEFVTHFISLKTAEWTSECLRWAHHTLDCETVCWLISSVRRTASHQLIERISDSTRHDAHQVTHADVPMELMVDSPDRLGIDRLLAAYATKQLIRPPFAIADIGSAITVDWVDQLGRFCGGAILPGLSLQAESLHRWTEALPNLNTSPNLGVETDSGLQLPGRNTAEAIRGGILVGAAGAIEALAARYSDPAAPCSIVLTGGQADLIAPHLEQNSSLLPNLVCRGLLELPRSKGNAETKTEVL
jgi:type III pantothenate kinase